MKLKFHNLLVTSIINSIQRTALLNPSADEFNRQPLLLRKGHTRSQQSHLSVTAQYLIASFAQNTVYSEQLLNYFRSGTEDCLPLICTEKPFMFGVQQVNSSCRTRHDAQ
jgi:hypothetical protein